MLVHEKAKSNNDQKTVNISIEEEWQVFGVERGH
jgi:hypothetical protein